MADDTIPDSGTYEGVCFDIEAMPGIRADVVSIEDENRDNPLRQKFYPAACWRIDDHRFDFDSSFPMPTVSQDFALLAQKRPPGPPASPDSAPPPPLIHVVQSGEWLDGIAKDYGFESWKDLYYANENADYRASHPDPNKLYPGDEIVIPGQTGSSDDPEPQEDPDGLRMTIFGHADPTGKDDYNFVLGGRRVKVIYGALIRDTKLWDEVYSTPHGGDSWGLRHHQIMLQATGYDPGADDGIAGPNTTAAVSDFQNAKGLPASGSIDRPTRRALFRAYMDVICVDKSGAPFRYSRKDFLSHGEGKDGKGDYQSCGEFNPVLVFSQDEEAEYKKPGKQEQRNADNIPNRRVTIYMFPPKPSFPIDRWPCPTVKENGTKCKEQFWIDGEARRSPQAERRESQNHGKTMACIWYSRMAWRGACEGTPLPERKRMVAPILNVTEGSVWVGSKTAKPIVASLGMSDAGNGARYRGDGRLHRSNKNVDLFLDEPCTKPLAFDGTDTAIIAQPLLRSGLNTYLKGNSPGTTELTLSLSASTNPHITIGPPVTRTVKIEASIRIRLHDHKRELLPNIWCQLSVIADALQSDTDAWVVADVFPRPEQVTVQWGGKSKDEAHPYSLEVRFDWDSAAESEQPAIRLQNIGYPRAKDNLHEAVVAFQYDYQVDHLPVPKGLVAGALPPATRERLWAIYDTRQCDAKKT